MKKILFLAIFSIISGLASASTEPESVLKTNNPRKPKARPSLPGNIVLDYGSNLLINSPDNFNTEWFGSRNFNFIYQREKRIGESKFAFAPGIGLTMQRYKFSSSSTLGFSINAAGERIVEVQPVGPEIGAVKKSMVITNYVDLPLEIRFYTNPNDVYRSFHVTLGAYVGVLFDSGTKIKHAQSGENKILKDKQSFDLNPLRYGAGIRIGVGGFNIYGRYNLSPLFRPGFGPGGEDFNALTLGFSVIGF